MNYVRRLGQISSNENAKIWEEELLGEATTATPIVDSWGKEFLREISNPNLTKTQEWRHEFLEAQQNGEFKYST